MLEKTPTILDLTVSSTLIIVCITINPDIHERTRPKELLLFTLIMLVRNHKGELVEINRKNYTSDNDFYAAIMKEVTGKNKTKSTTYIVSDLVSRVKSLQKN